MMISFRTLVNTTLFWFIVVLSFWAYTRRVNTTPAKELLYAIGWADLGNLTVTKQEVISMDEQSTLIQKIDGMEKMMQAINMSCALAQMNNQSSTHLIEQGTPTTTTMIQVPVFSAIHNAQLPAQSQFGDKALVKIKRETHVASTDIPQLFDVLVGLSLQEDEKKQGLVNVFEGSQLQLHEHSINGAVLTLKIK